MSRMDNEALPTHKEEDKQGLVEGDDYETNRLPPIEAAPKGQWIESDNDRPPTERGARVHVDNRLQDVLNNADIDREKEIRELREKARIEEQKEVEELLSRPQPAIPSGWDYLILPRKINLLRVKTPPTIM